MSRVSYDNPHHHHADQPSPIKAGNSAGVELRGGGGGGAGIELTGSVVTANGTGGDGVRHGGGAEGIVPSPGFPAGVTAIDSGGTAGRLGATVDRRSTGRYAYASTSSSSAGGARDGAAPISGGLKDVRNVSGGGGGGVRVVEVTRTTSTSSSSSPLLSKAKDL